MVDDESKAAILASARGLRDAAERIEKDVAAGRFGLAADQGRAAAQLGARVVDLIEPLSKRSNPREKLVRRALGYTVP